MLEARRQTDVHTLTLDAPSAKLEKARDAYMRLRESRFFDPQKLAWRVGLYIEEAPRRRLELWDALLQSRLNIPEGQALFHAVLASPYIPPVFKALDARTGEKERQKDRLFVMMLERYCAWKIDGASPHLDGLPPSWDGADRPDIALHLMAALVEYAADPERAARRLDILRKGTEDWPWLWNQRKQTWAYGYGRDTHEQLLALMLALDERGPGASARYASLKDSYCYNKERGHWRAYYHEEAGTRESNEKSVRTEDQLVALLIETELAKHGGAGATTSGNAVPALLDIK